VLGICYGLQWMSQHTGGEVTPAKEGAEYGRTELRVDDATDLLAGCRQDGIVWMSHGDKVAKLGSSSAVLARSEPCPFAVVADRARGFFGMQFHPEVAHTEDGAVMLRNFVVGVARCRTDWNPGNLIDAKVEAVRKLVGDTGEVVMGLSGLQAALASGLPLSEALTAVGLATPLSTRLLRAGERSGQLAQMLDRVAAFHDDEVARDVERIARVAEPLLMLGLGLMIGGVVLLLYLPIFDLAGGLQ